MLYYRIHGFLTHRISNSEVVSKFSFYLRAIKIQLFAAFNPFLTTPVVNIRKITNAKRYFIFHSTVSSEDFVINISIRIVLQKNNNQKMITKHVKHLLFQCLGVKNSPLYLSSKIHFDFEK